MANKTIRELPNISSAFDDPTNWSGGYLILAATDLTTYNISLGQIARAVSIINPAEQQLGPPEGAYPSQNPVHTFTFLDTIERELEFKNLYFDKFYGWCEAWALSYKTNARLWTIALWSLSSKTWVRGARRDMTNNSQNNAPVNTHSSGIVPLSDLAKIQEYEFIDLGKSLSLEE